MEPVSSAPYLCNEEGLQLLKEAIFASQTALDKINKLRHYVKEQMSQKYNCSQDQSHVSDGSIDYLNQSFDTNTIDICLDQLSKSRLGKMKIEAADSSDYLHECGTIKPLGSLNPSAVKNACENIMESDWSNDAPSNQLDGSIKDNIVRLSPQHEGIGLTSQNMNNHSIVSQEKMNFSSQVCTNEDYIVRRLPPQHHDGNFTSHTQQGPRVLPENSDISFRVSTMEDDIVRLPPQHHDSNFTSRNQHEFNGVSPLKADFSMQVYRKKDNIVRVPPQHECFDFKSQNLNAHSIISQEKTDFSSQVCLHEDNIVRIPPHHRDANFTSWNQHELRFAAQQKVNFSSQVYSNEDNIVRVPPQRECVDFTSQNLNDRSIASQEKTDFSSQVCPNEDNIVKLSPQHGDANSSSCNQHELSSASPQKTDFNSQVCPNEDDIVRLPPQHHDANFKCNQHEPSTSSPEKLHIGCKVYFSTEHQSLSEAELNESLGKEGFKNFSAVIKNVESYSFGFITFSNEDSAKRALNMSLKIHVGGKPMKISNMRRGARKRKKPCRKTSVDNAKNCFGLISCSSTNQGDVQEINENILINISCGYQRKRRNYR